VGTSRLAVALAVLAGGAVLLGAQSSSQWFVQETSMTADGKLTFREKPWWPRAAKLAEGESFTLDLNRDGRPDTVVERQGGHIIQTIDDSGRAADIPKS
jgi:hypothetical protein